MTEQQRNNGYELAFDLHWPSCRVFSMPIWFFLLPFLPLIYDVAAEATNYEY